MPNVKSEAVNRRKDNTMTTKQMKRQTMVNQRLHRKLRLGNTVPQTTEGD